MARAAPAASRAVAIISFLTANPSRGFTISELVHHLGMNIASAHATLAVLCDAGLLVRDPVHRTYILGPAVAASGFAAAEQHPAIPAAIREAETLAEELDAEIGISAIAGRDVILLARRGPVPRLATIGYPGDRTPLLAPLGAVFMAWAPEPAVAEWLERAGLDETAAVHLRAAMAEIRRRGFSVPLKAISAPAVIRAMEHFRSEPTDPSAEGEVAGALQGADETLLSLERSAPEDLIAFKTVAAPIFDPIGRVLLSISVSGPETPLPRAEVIRLGRRLQQSAMIATREGRGRVPAVRGGQVAGR